MTCARSGRPPSNSPPTSEGDASSEHQPAGTSAVLADLEAIVRASAPFPTGACKPTVAELLPATENALKTYEDILARHLAYAADHLDP